MKTQCMLCNYEFTYCILSFIIVLPVTVDKNYFVFIYLTRKIPLRYNISSTRESRAGFPDNH